jgi:hypothetical protein
MYMVLSMPQPFCGFAEILFLLLVPILFASSSSQNFLLRLKGSYKQWLEVDTMLLY